MKIFVTGQIVDSKCDGCFSPIDLKEQLESVDANEPLEVEITSEGGSVFAGMQIANILSRHQGKVTTHAVGLCASIATIILMAGDEVAVDDNCFCMIHRPWSCIEGNANDMAKEIEALDKCETAMMAYYMKRAKVDSQVLSKYLSDESWFLGAEFAEVFNCNVVPSDKVFNIAAKCDLTRFNKLDNRISKMEEKEEKTEEVIETVETVETVEEPEVVEEKEETVEEETVEELKKKISMLEEKLAEYEKEEQKDMVTKEDCEKRVSGMQAKMQLQINDFVNQLKVRDEELANVKADAIRLQNELDKSSNELSKMTSALVEKENALAMLNAGVNARPIESKPSGWGKLEGKDFFNYLKKNNGILTIKNK